MSKIKILIGFVVVIGVIALLPILGNNIADEILKEKISQLKANGLELKNDKTDSSYFSTKKHYEFLLLDAPRFINYINNNSDAKIPSYSNKILSGTTVGVDISYSNFPFSSKIIVDVYPLALPTELMNELRNEDMNFYIYVDKLLKSKAILYHINYFLSDGFFNGFIKNLDEEYMFDNGAKMSIKLLDATYYGEGSLAAPKNLQTSISQIALNIEDSNENVTFEIYDLTSASTFESQSTYAAGASMKSMLISVLKDKGDDLKIYLDNVKVNISSNTQGKKAEFYTKSSIEEFKINSLSLNMLMHGFNYNLSLAGVDKDSYEEFIKLSSQASSNNSKEFDQKLQKTTIKLLSKGLSLSIADLSMDKIIIKDKKAIDGFSMMARAVLKEDADLEAKLRNSSKSLVKNINLASTIKFSKELYVLINQLVPITAIANSFAKEKNNKLVFEIKLNNSKLSINDKVMN
jgi:hypothetical protein